MIKDIVIAFLIGLLVGNLAFGMKLPDVILNDQIDPNLREIIEDYIVKILNGGKYQCRVSSTSIASDTSLVDGEFLLDTGAASKYLVISDGTINYRVEVTAIP